ncbi:MAG: helix-turn-helix transcriptional regulator [Sporocytophaga sp.]|nr:helix-turn-helix transcriptional regulator [Sporocytophaga sp.]
MAYTIREPEAALADFVERFWTLQNDSGNDKEQVTIPDGRIDIIFSCSPNEPYLIGLIGIETAPSSHIFPAGSLMCGVSFKLSAVEYLPDINISGLVNQIQILPEDFWGITETDLSDFEIFCQKLSERIKSMMVPDIDKRKKQLFELVYSTKGSMSIKDLSEKISWSSRQINRYFNQQFGISLKLFCSILRFRASFPHIKEGRLYPELNFADQAHFIREVKKLSGVTPKELFKNQNDRFVQFSTLTDE